MHRMRTKLGPRYDLENKVIYSISLILFMKFESIAWSCSVLGKQQMFSNHFVYLLSLQNLVYGGTQGVLIVCLFREIPKRFPFLYFMCEDEFARINFELLYML